MKTLETNSLLRELFMFEIIQATEQDIPIIEDILLDAHNWLVSVGQQLWEKEWITWEGLSIEFKPSNFYIALLDHMPVGCMALVDSDPAFWPDVEKGTSLFIHKLAVKRTAAGKGVSQALIAYAKEECKRRKIRALRLDAHALRPKLRAVYERNGFVCVGERVLPDEIWGEYHSAFYLYEL